MAKKVRCPACGAKNKSELDRCRVCLTPMHLGQQASSEPIDIPDHMDNAAPDAPPPPLEAPPEEVEEFIPIDLPAGPEVEPPPPTRNDPVVADAEHFDPNSLQIDEGRYRRPQGTPVIAEKVDFDPNSLVIEREPDTPPPPPPPSGEHFDPDALEINDPTRPNG